MGVDPGLVRTGYGIIDIIHDKPDLVDFGIISNSGKKNIPVRLVKIYDRISQIIDSHKPDVLAIEEVFFSENPQSALKLGQARASVILAAMHNKLPVFEYSALEVKKSITSYGRASKEQVQSMVKILLNMDAPPKPSDSADALAIAICHSHSMKFQSLTQQ
jgi:crossover junction endodeoxyribonuclease RuvC